MSPKFEIRSATKHGWYFIRNSGNFTSVGKDQVLKNLSVPIVEKIEQSVEFVDNTLGVSEVVKAQEEVTVKETSFLSARGNVHEVGFTLREVQEHLNDIRKKLDRTDRTNENYLALVADEHKLLLEVGKLKKSHDEAEGIERKNFIEYSSAVRLSHEKERSRVERTKYWSIIGSISGTVLGFFLSSIVTHYRLKSMKDLHTATVQNATGQINLSLDEKFSTIFEDISNAQLVSSNSQSEETALSAAQSSEASYKELRDSILSSIAQSEEILNQDKEILSISRKLNAQLSQLHSLWQENISKHFDATQTVGVSEKVDVLKDVPVSKDVLVSKETDIPKDVVFSKDTDFPEEVVAIEIESSNERAELSEDNGEGTIDILHTTMLVIAGAAVCLYGFLGNS